MTNEKEKQEIQRTMYLIHWICSHRSSYTEEKFLRASIALFDLGKKYPDIVFEPSDYNRDYPPVDPNEGLAAEIL